MIVICCSAEAFGWFKEVLPILAALVAATIPVYFGARAFFSQKEHEIVQRRYLESGFDELAAMGERALNSHNHNWAYVLNLVKILRDVPSELNESEFTLDKFKHSDQQFPYAAASRVIRLTQSRLPWDALQLVVSFSNKSHEFCVIEVPKVLRAFLEGRANGTNEEIAQECAEYLRQLMLEADKHHDALGQINVLAMNFESSKFSFRKLGSFHKGNTVQQALSRLQEYIDAFGPKEDETGRKAASPHKAG